MSYCAVRLSPCTIQLNLDNIPIGIVYEVRAGDWVSVEPARSIGLERFDDPGLAAKFRWGNAAKNAIDQLDAVDLLEAAP